MAPEQSRQGGGAVVGLLLLSPHPGFGSGRGQTCARLGTILFPEGDRGGSVLDDVYLTILSSNTLG
jgi:hypothetical protein